MRSAHRILGGCSPNLCRRIPAHSSVEGRDCPPNTEPREDEVKGLVAAQECSEPRSGWKNGIGSSAFTAEVKAAARMLGISACLLRSRIDIGMYSDTAQEYGAHLEDPFSG